LIRSGRQSLHTDFIDLNKARHQVNLEAKEKKKSSLSSIGNSLRRGQQTMDEHLRATKKSKEVVN
jgi:hypothetical protein